MKEHELISAVQASAPLADVGEAEQAVRATLEVLGQRLTGGEPGDLAAQLPPALAEMLPSRGAGDPFSVEEFYRRVAKTEGSHDPLAARRHARAVAGALKSALSPGELRDVLAQLPADYEDLFATRGPVR